MGVHGNATYVQDQVTRILLRLMEEQTYGELSVSQLTAAAQVGRSSFYRNFTGRDDVLRQYQRRLLDAWRADFAGTPGQDISESLLRYFYAHRDFYLLLYRSGPVWIIYAGIKAFCGVTEELPPILACGAAAIAGAVFGWTETRLSRGMTETPEELKRLAAEIEGQRSAVPGSD